MGKKYEMGNIYFKIIALIFFAALSSAAQTGQTNQRKGTLVVMITGLKTTSGDVQIGLFDSKESYDGKKSKFAGAIIKVESVQVKWVIKDLPYGQYAIKAFHDQNGNNKIDTNFLGMPVEKFGFSNNIKSFFGVPKFDKVKFNFNRDAMSIKVVLH